MATIREIFQALRSAMSNERAVANARMLLDQRGDEDHMVAALTDNLTQPIRQAAPSAA
ncbi:MAG: hypothetical protein ACRD0U_16610 [Acidimicrobiales bacterium]